MDSSAIIGDKTKHKNIPNEDGSNLCVCCKRYNLHYSKKYNINASNREAYVAAFNFDVPIGVCCNSCYNKQYRFSKNNAGGGSGTEEEKPKKKRNSRKMSIASSSSSTHSNSENNVDENVNEEENSSNSNHSLKRSSNCSSPDEVVSAKKRKCSLTSLVTTTNTTTTVDQTLAADQPQETTPWNALSTQDDEFLNLLNSIPNNNVKPNNSVETLQIPHQPPQTYSASLQTLLADMASTNHHHTSHNIPINTNQYPDMLVYNQFNRMTSPSKSTTTNQSFVDMVLGQDNQSTNMLLNSMDINQLAMKKMKHSNIDVAQDQLTLSSAHLSNPNTEMVQPFGILDSNNTSTPSIITSNFSNSGSQMYNLSPSSAPFLSQLFSLPNNNNNGNLQYTYPTITPQYSPKGTAQAAMFIIFFDDSRILTTTDYSYYENSLMTSKFSIHKCCSFSYLCDQLSEKMVNEKKLWNSNMLKSITQIKLKRNGVLTPMDPYTTPQCNFEHGDVLLVHLV